MIEGILPFAKFTGETSFASLWRVKHGLGTKKIGHTGTLDRFADGLLVVLVGSLTRLVPYFTACDKEYVARVSFGSETDTLDPEGTVVSTGTVPDAKRVSEALRSFVGAIDQVPPAYSAIHVTGRRASDIARKGDIPALEPRSVTVNELELVRDDLSENASVDIRVSCSKGTYVRSLARDIARACGTVAYVSSLRRTRVGPFSFGDSVNSGLIAEFGVPYDALGRGRSGVTGGNGVSANASFDRFLLAFTEPVARSIGLDPVTLRRERIREFSNGMPLEADWFESVADYPDGRHEGVSRPVFSGADFLGMVVKRNGRLSYDFVHRVDA